MDYLSEFILFLLPAARAGFRPSDRRDLERRMRVCGMDRLPDPKPEAIRVAAYAACPICGQMASAHPLDWRVVGYDGEPFLQIYCDGQRIKL